MRSLRAQLGVIFLGFLLLVTGSVGATFVAVQAQEDDATEIDVAGRQRMLTQQVTWLALAQPDSAELAASIQLFNQSLVALRDGGTTLDGTGQGVVLPPAPNEDLRAQLDLVAQQWAVFRSHLQPLDSAALQAESPLILAQLDSLVSKFEDHTQAELTRIQIVQLVFLVAALLLLGWGYLTTRRRIIQPLSALQAATRRMAGGHLSDPIPPMHDDELGELGQALEAMRVEIGAAHDHLETRVAQRTHELALAFELSQEIVGQLDLDHLLCSVTDRARALTRAEAASLRLLDDDGTTLVLAATSGDAAAQASLRQPMGCVPSQQVLVAGQTTVAQVVCADCSLLRAHAPGQSIIAPLRLGKPTRSVGTLCVVRGEAEPFDPDETRALTLLANSAAIAIANARLAEAGRRKAEEAATLAERERLSAELHDHLAQTLGFLNLETDRLREALAAGHNAEAESKLEQLKSTVNMAYGQVRAALVGLHVPPPTAGDLLQRLEAYLDEFRQAAGILADLSVADPSALALSSAMQMQVLHVVREALTNVRRHAQARRVWVRVERANGEARFTIKDDGRGFNAQEVAGDLHHLGLTIMRVRAERSGGGLTVDSTPGAGTRIVVCFPLHPTQSPPDPNPAGELGEASR